MDGFACCAAGVSVFGSACSCALAKIIHLRLRYRPLEAPQGPLDGRTGPEGEPLRLLFTGDSLCLGVGGQRAAAFQAACAEQLAAGGSPVEWKTVAGDGVDVDELCDTIETVELGRFDIVIILCGVNDFKQLLTRCRMPRRFRQSLVRLCDLLRGRCEGCRIVIPCILGLFYCPPLLQSCLLREAMGASFDMFEAQKTRVAGVEAPCMPRSMIPRPEDETLWGTDGLHPSSEGYAVVGAWLGRLLAK
mmetsp:Transcript_65958/g.143703  ORF Transcript_65958/g.143703 Transcript_65958/m.143703 type:complete len:247 (-) Transcript_65958:199-939(-)